MAAIEPRWQTTGAVTALDREPKTHHGRHVQDTTPCSTCGDTKGRKTGPTGKDLNERVLRQRRCSNGHVYVTVEAALPPDIYFADVDYFFRQVKRDSDRRRGGITKFRPKRMVSSLEMVIGVVFKRDGTSVFKNDRNRPERRILT